MRKVLTHAVGLWLAGAAVLAPAPVAGQPPAPAPALTTIPAGKPTQAPRQHAPVASIDVTTRLTAAWKLVQYMTSSVYQQQVLQKGFALPTLKSLESDPYFMQNPGVKVLQDGAQYGHADFYGPADNKIHSELATALESVMLGKSSVQDALNGAATNVDTYIQQNVGP